MIDPTVSPRVAIKTTGININVPFVTKNPEKGIKTSEGIGINAASDVFSKKTPQ